MVQMIPPLVSELQILEVGGGVGKSTTQIKDELRIQKLNFFLDVFDYNEYNRFYLSMVVPPTQLFIKNFPSKKYHIVFLPEGIRDPSVLYPLVYESSMIIIRFPKLLKRFLEHHFVCAQSIETHWYFGIYKCYLKSKQNIVVND
jgi:hypothetical protein